VGREAALEKPVFLFGTGRCGSTFVQQLICQRTRTWMWGEHDGILDGIMDWSNSVQNSPLLSTFSFPGYSRCPVARLTEGGNVAAWLNGFSAGHPYQIERFALHSLFADTIPEGWDRWGFKEIRYGQNSRVPSRLVELFPDARIIHLVRHPLATSDSSVRAWNRDAVNALARGELDARERVCDAYFRYLKRWVDTTSFFLGLEQELSANLRTFRLEDITLSQEGIFNFIGEEDVGERILVDIDQKNGAAIPEEIIPEYRNLVLNLERDAWPLVASVAAKLAYSRDLM
jgi:hypothetical protein